MKRAIACATLLVLVFTAGCGDSHKAVARDEVSLMKDLVSVLQGIKDEASATAAKDKIKALMDKGKALQARRDKLGTPTEADAKAIAELDKERQETTQKLFTEFMRVASIPGVDRAMADLGEGMPKMK